ncbi:hypothetical protein GCM10020331_057890 [Ectobacillus funiculus]
MEQERYPVVFVDRKIEGVHIDTVVVNNREATCEAVSHLLENGHRNIAIVTPPLTTHPRKERLAGYKQALEQHGIALNENYMKSVEISAISYELENMFSLSEKPTALVAANDLSFF